MFCDNNVTNKLNSSLLFYFFTISGKDGTMRNSPAQRSNCPKFYLTTQM